MAVKKVDSEVDDFFLQEGEGSEPIDIWGEDEELEQEFEEGRVTKDGSEEDGGLQEESNYESAYETVSRLYEEAEEEGSEDLGSEDQNGTTQGGKVLNDKQAPEAPESPVVEPQGRLDATQREIFAKLPPELKQGYNEMIKHHEAAFTRTQQQYAKAAGDAQHILNVVRPYVQSNPTLAASGMGEAEVVANLIEAHKKLCNPDKAAAKAEYVKLGKLLNLDVAETGEVSQVPDISAHPQFKDLQSKLNRLYSEYGKGLQAQEQQRVNAVVSEIESVRNAKDVNGKYLYPQLFNAEFVQRLKPLVVGIRETVPNLSWGDAFKKAYAVTVGGNFSDPNPARLLASDNNRSRAIKAGASVRGRGRTAGDSSYEEIPKEALGSARDTVAWAYKMLEERGE